MGILSFFFRHFVCFAVLGGSEKAKCAVELFRCGVGCGGGSQVSEVGRNRVHGLFENPQAPEGVIVVGGTDLVVVKFFGYIGGPLGVVEDIVVARCGGGGMCSLGDAVVVSGVVIGPDSEEGNWCVE